MGWYPKIHWDARGYGYARIGGRVRYLGKKGPKAHRQFARLLDQHGYSQQGQQAPQFIAELAERWFLEYPERKYRWYLQPWLEFAGRVSLDETEVDHLEKYARHLRRNGYQRQERINSKLQAVHHTYKPWTIRKYIQYARVCLAFAKTQGWLAEVPPKPKRLPQPVQNPRHATDAELAAVFASLPQRAGLILTFLLETGARPKEACGLRWDQIDLRSGTCQLADHKTADSGGEARTIYLTAAALGILDQLPHRRGLVFTNRLGKRYTTSGLRAIIIRRGLTTYRLRHTFAQHALDNGVDITILAKLLGQKTLRQVQVYARVRDARVRAVAQGLTSPLQRQPVADRDDASKASRARRSTRGRSRRKSDSGPAGSRGRDAGAAA